MILHHQRIKRVQTVHLSSNVANLISYPGNIHNMRMCISLMLSNAFSSYLFGLPPLNTTESLKNNERRRFMNHPNQPCKSGKKSKSMNKSVVALFCVPNISIFRINTYSPVLTLFSCVIGCYIWVG